MASGKPLWHFNLPPWPVWSGLRFNSGGVATRHILSPACCGVCTLCRVCHNCVLVTACPFVPKPVCMHAFLHGSAVDVAEGLKKYARAQPLPWTYASLNPCAAVLFGSSPVHIGCLMMLRTLTKCAVVSF